MSEQLSDMEAAIRRVCEAKGYPEDMIQGIIATYRRRQSPTGAER